MSKLASITITAADQWSAVFQAQGTDAVIGARIMEILCTGGSGHTYTLRWLDDDGTTVLAEETFSGPTEVADISVTGLFTVGIAPGGFGLGDTTVVVRQ